MDIIIIIIITTKMNDTRSGKKELCQQIQVFVRIR